MRNRAENDEDAISGSVRLHTFASADGFVYDIVDRQTLYNDVAAGQGERSNVSVSRPPIDGHRSTPHCSVCIGSQRLNPINVRSTQLIAATTGPP